MNAPQRRDIKPRYEVVRLEGEVEVEVLEPHTRTIKQGTKERETTTWKRVKKMVPAGFMVYLPNKSSYRVFTVEKLQSLGLDVPPELVDMETGDIVPPVETVSLKKQVERSVQSSRKLKTTAAKTGHDSVVAATATEGV